MRAAVRRPRGGNSKPSADSATGSNENWIGYDRLSSGHQLLWRVTVIVLAAILGETAVVIWNSVRITHDRDHQVQRIDDEICRLIAHVPGDLRRLEGELGCPITAPLPEPTQVRPGPTVTVRPTVTAPAPERTGSAARPGPAITPTPASRVGTRPALTPSPMATATTTPGPSPTPTPLLCVLRPIVQIGACP